MSRGLGRFRIKLDREQATEMTCQNANCEQWRFGWFNVADPATAEGAEFATWVEERSRRKYFKWESATALEEAVRRQTSGDINLTPELVTFLQGLRPGLIVFAFPSGQRCFKEHLDREVIFSGAGSGRKYVFERPREFNEAWDERADEVNTAKARG